MKKSSIHRLYRDFDLLFYGDIIQKYGDIILNHGDIIQFYGNIIQKYGDIIWFYGDIILNFFKQRKNSFYILFPSKIYLNFPF